MEIYERIQQLYEEEAGGRAVQFEGQWWTWGDLARLGEGIHAALNAKGVASGRGVGLVLRQRPQGLGSYLALIGTRRCAVLITPIQPDQSMGEELQTLRLPVLIAEKEDLEREGLIDAARHAGTVGILITGSKERPIKLIDELSEIGPEPRYEPLENTAVTILTSGTTGRPKRVPYSFDHLRGQPPANPRPIEQRGVNIAAVPLASLGGILGMASAVWRGRAYSLMDRFDVWKWAELVKEHKPRRLGAPPAAVRMLLDEKVPKEYMESGQVFSAASAPLDQATADEFERVYGIPVVRAYGATEFLGAITAFSDSDLQLAKEKRGSVGRAVPGCSIRIVDPDSGEELPAGDIGLLEADPPKRPADTPDGWIRTNDLARMDEDGYIWIVGRADGVIIRGGFKVPSEEVADILIGHEAVSEAAVVGLPDPRLGQLPVAAVVLRPGFECSESELKAWVKARKPGYCVPASVVFVDELPRNHMMKVIPGEVVKLVSENLEAD